MQSRKKRIYEQKRSIKTNDDRNALFSHMLEFKHTFNFPQAIQIKPIHSKNSWRLLESAAISKTNHIKQRPGFYQISPYLAKHHTKRKQNQNRKRIGKKIIHSVPPYF